MFLVVSIMLSSMLHAYAGSSFAGNGKVICEYVVAEFVRPDKSKTRYLHDKCKCFEDTYLKKIAEIGKIQRGEVEQVKVLSQSGSSISTYFKSAGLENYYFNSKDGCLESQSRSIQGGVSPKFPAD